MKDVGAVTRISNFKIKQGFPVVVNNIKSAGMFGLLAAVLIFIISPIVTSLAKFAVPLNGIIYCTSTGYIIGFVAHAVEAFRPAIILAFLLTLVLFLALAIVYSTGKIQVTAKFKAAFFGIVLASLIFSLLMLVFSFIPALQFIPRFFKGNTVFAVIGSVIGLIIAVIFVIVDFSVIQDAVDRQLPKRYEWFCAYALAFSFIYLYFKVLDILLRLIGKNKSGT